MRPSFDPCGMRVPGLDLRSCYETDCVFFQDGTVGRIRYFFVTENTPYLPFGTTFLSDDWDDVPQGDAWPLGEVPGAVRTWANGDPPYPMAADRPCGTAQQFKLGDPRPTTPALNVFGGLTCCNIKAPPNLTLTCVRCPGGTWDVMCAIVAGVGPAPYAGAVNGRFTLRYRGGCIWNSDVFPVPGSADTFFYALGLGTNDVGFALNTALFANCCQWLRTPRNWDCNSTLRMGPTSLIVPPITTPGATAIILPGVAAGPGVFVVNFNQFLPPDLSVRVQPVGTGFIDRIRTGDFPLAFVGNSAWQGEMWFDFRVPLLPVIRFPVFRTMTLNAFFDGHFELSCISPHGYPFVYASAPVAPWNQLPVALMLQQPAPILLGLPQSVTLFTQDNLPP